LNIVLIKILFFIPNLCFSSPILWDQDSVSDSAEGRVDGPPVRGQGREAHRHPLEHEQQADWWQHRPQIYRQVREVSSLNGGYLYAYDDRYNFLAEFSLLLMHFMWTVFSIPLPGHFTNRYRTVPMWKKKTHFFQNSVFFSVSKKFLNSYGSLFAFRIGRYTLRSGSQGSG
jgi:hypothetical protein